MEFDGEDDVVDAGSAGSLDDIFQNGGTISGWIKPRGWGELNLLKDDRFTRSERYKPFTVQALPGILDRECLAEHVCPRRPGPCS
jgi:hypothetical protein